MDRQQLLVFSVLPVVFCSQITVVSVTRARSVGLIATSGVFPVTVSVHRDSSTQSSTTPVKRVSMSESTPGGHVAQWIHTVAYTHTYTPPPTHTHNPSINSIKRLTKINRNSQTIDHPCFPPSTVPSTGPSRMARPVFPCPSAVQRTSELNCTLSLPSFSLPVHPSVRPSS